MIKAIKESSCLTKIVLLVAVSMFLIHWYKAAVTLLIIGLYMTNNDQTKNALSQARKLNSVKKAETDMIENVKSIDGNPNIFRGLEYVELRNRDQFHRLLASQDNNVRANRYYFSKLDKLGRIVGGAVTITPTRLKSNFEMINSKRFDRDNEARRNSLVPGFESVKKIYKRINGTGYNLYHRTHLVPFRFCLNDGEFKNVLFTGTARLNMGLRASEDFVPTKQLHEQNVETILASISRNPYAYYEFDSTTNLSLDDFERVATKVLNYTKHKGNLFKYGVECHYEDAGMIPSYVEVVMVDVTSSRIVFIARLRNEI